MIKSLTAIFFNKDMKLSINYNIVTCYLLPWRRGLTHLTFYQTFAGSNPVGSTNNYMLDNCYVSIMSKDMMIQKSMTDKTCEAVCS